MIRADAIGDTVRLSSDLRPGSSAYLDAEWIRHADGPVAAVIADERGTVSWNEEFAIAVPEAVGLDRAVALAFSAVARDAHRAVSAVPRAQIEVAGTGFLASRIRAFLGLDTDATHAVDSPVAFIDTTGAPDNIVAATRRLQDLGTLVLVGESRNQLDLDLYPDVHVRGLTLVGVAPPLAHGAPWEDRDSALTEELEESFESPEYIAMGTPIPAGARWYRLSGA